MNYDQKAQEIFEQNKAIGWWDDMDRDIYETLQLVVTEIAEATEAARMGSMDAHLPHRTGEEVELADALIRVLDMAGRYGWKHVHGEAGWGLRDNGVPISGTDKPVGALHFFCTAAVAALGEVITVPNSAIYLKHSAYSRIVNSLVTVAKIRGLDIFDATAEKLAYNQVRADHTREARAAENGKKF